MKVVSDPRAQDLVTRPSSDDAGHNNVVLARDWRHLFDDWIRREGDRYFNQSEEGSSDDSSPVLITNPPPDLTTTFTFDFPVFYFTNETLRANITIDYLGNGPTVGAQVGYAKYRLLSADWSCIAACDYSGNMGNRTWRVLAVHGINQNVLWSTPPSPPPVPDTIEFEILMGAQFAMVMEVQQIFGVGVGQGNSIIAGDEEENQPVSLTHPKLKLIFNARQENGKSALIVGSDKELYRYWRYEDNDIVDNDVVEPAVVGTICEGVWLKIGDNFTVLNNHRWEAKNVNGYTVFNNGIDLPVSYHLNEFAVKPIKELREQGVTYVGTIEEVAGILVLADIGEIQDDYLEVVMENVQYGGFANAQEQWINRIHNRVMWGDPISPLRWGASVPGTIVAGSRYLEFQYRIDSLEQGDTVRIVGAGVDGADLITTLLYITETLGGDIYPRPVWVVADKAATSVAGAAVSKSDAAALIVGQFPVNDDTSAIIRLTRLGDRIVVAKQNGFVISEYTGRTDAPFSFLRVYSGEESLHWRWMIHELNDQLIYAGRDGFYTFDLVRRTPQLHPALSLCANIFIDAVGVASVSQDDVWMVNNGLTKEMWFMFPSQTDDKGICFDYNPRALGGQRCTTIGAHYESAAMIDKPQEGIARAPVDRMFLMGTSDGRLVQYLIDRTGPTGWQRRGANYPSILWSGVSDFNDEEHAKEFLRYLFLLASQSPNTSVEIQFWKADNANADLTQLPDSPITLSNPKVRNHIPLNYLAILLQERITVSGSANLRIRKRRWEIGITAEVGERIIDCAAAQAAAPSIYGTSDNLIATPATSVAYGTVAPPIYGTSDLVATPATSAASGTVGGGACAFELPDPMASASPSFFKGMAGTDFVDALWVSGFSDEMWGGSGLGYNGKSGNPYMSEDGKKVIVKGNSGGVLVVTRSDANAFTLESLNYGTAVDIEPGYTMSRAGMVAGNVRLPGFVYQAALWDNGVTSAPTLSPTIRKWNFISPDGLRLYGITSGYRAVERTIGGADVIIDAAEPAYDIVAMDHCGDTLIIDCDNDVRVYKKVLGVWTHTGTLADEAGSVVDYPGVIGCDGDGTIAFGNSGAGSFKIFKWDLSVAGTITGVLLGNVANRTGEQRLSGMARDGSIVVGWGINSSTDQTGLYWLASENYATAHLLHTYLNAQSASPAFSTAEGEYVILDNVVVSANGRHLFFRADKHYDFAPSDRGGYYAAVPLPT